MSTNQQLIFFPLLAHVFLVFFLFIKLGAVKSAAVKAGLVDRSKAALDNSAWPESVLKVSNNINNQFQIPMLFYALSFTLFLTQSVNTFVLLLMTLFVITRYVHSYIHITSNYVPHRFKAFVLGTLLLLVVTTWQLISLLQQL